MINCALLLFMLLLGRIDIPHADHAFRGDYQELKGSWDFYWQKFYRDDTTLIHQIADTTIVNPKTWNSYRIKNQSLSGNGYATYITRIHSDKKLEIALRLKGFYSAYRIYLNGELLGGNGAVGHCERESSLEWRPQLLEGWLVGGENLLVIEVSNFQHSKGGFYHPIVMGDFAELTAMKETDMMIDVFTAGAFFMIGVFFLGMFFTWRQDSGYLIYALLALSYAVRILSNGTHLLKLWLAELHWSLLVRIEYFSFYLVWWSSLALIAMVLPRRVYGLFSGLFLLFMLVVLFIPLAVYSQILMPSVFIGFTCYGVCLVSLFYKYRGLTVRTFYSILIFLLIALSGWILEFFIYAETLDGFVALPNLFRLLAVLSLAFLISDRYTIEYEQVEALSTEAMTQKKVIEGQYNQLKEQQKTLQERNQEIETLLQEVHHRVKNNLQLVSSMLDVGNIEEQPGKALDILEDSKARVFTMSLIHQNLYMSEHLTNISLSEYMSDLIANIEELHLGNRQLKLDMDIGDWQFDLDTMVPLGLIVNELVTNGLKYAPKLPVVYLGVKVLEVQTGEFQLKIMDQGSPLPDDFSTIVQSGYGLRLAHRLAQQLMGDLTHYYNEGNIFTINFWTTDKRKSTL